MSNDPRTNTLQEAQGLAGPWLEKAYCYLLRMAVTKDMVAIAEQKSQHLALSSMPLSN